MMLGECTWKKIRAWILIVRCRKRSIQQCKQIRLFPFFTGHATKLKIESEKDPKTEGLWIINGCEHNTRMNRRQKAEGIDGLILCKKRREPISNKDKQTRSMRIMTEDIKIEPSFPRRNEMMHFRRNNDNTTCKWRWGNGGRGRRDCFNHQRQKPQHESKNAKKKNNE